MAFELTSLLVRRVSMLSSGGKEGPKAFVEMLSVWNTRGGGVVGSETNKNIIDKMQLL